MSGALLAATSASATSPGANGRLLYGQAAYVPHHPKTNDYGPAALRTMAPDGSGDTAISTPYPNEFSAAFSPDGLQIAFATYKAKSSTNGVWVSQASGGGPEEVASSDFVEFPSWASDGKAVLFDDQYSVWKTVVAGNSAPTKLVAATKTTSFWDAKMTPDGSALVFIGSRYNRRGRVTSEGIWTADGNGRNPHRLVGGSGSMNAASGPTVSPDGTHVAFVVNTGAAATDGLYEAGIDGTGARLIAKATSERYALVHPAWSPDGTKIAVVQHTASARGGATLELADAATGALTVLKHVAHGGLLDPSWQPLPAAS